MAEEKNLPRKLVLYRQEIVGKLRESFNHSSSLSVCRLMKITVNMGVGDGITDSKIVDKAAADLAQITGQKAKICRAKKPISNFKLRKGVPIGCCVTLRRYMMYEFFDRLVSIAMPRIRDFRGFSPRGFDGNGNYNFGLVDQTVFPEINVDKVSRTLGMNISITTNSSDDQEAKELLKLMGFPFKKQTSNRETL